LVLAAGQSGLALLWIVLREAGSGLGGGDAPLHPVVVPRPMPVVVWAGCAQLPPALAGVTGAR